VDLWLLATLAWLGGFELGRQSVRANDLPRGGYLLLALALGAAAALGGACMGGP
jgi:hypothetical protein